MLNPHRSGLQVEDSEVDSYYRLETVGVTLVKCCRYTGHHRRSKLGSKSGGRFIEKMIQGRLMVSPSMTKHFNRMVSRLYFPRG